MSIRSYLHFFLFIVLGFTIYSGVINAPFVFDDGLYIVGNPPIRDLSSFLDFSGTRYIGFLSFAVNYAISALDVTGYNLTNIGIHVINAFLVYLMLLLIARTPYMDELLESAPGIPLLAGLVFLVHPVESQAVCYITQRFASLATLFYLASVVLYIRYRVGPRGGDGQGSGSLFFYILSLAACILAQKTKEISFTLPVMILMCEFIFFTGDDGGFLARIKRVFPFLLTMLIIPLTLFSSDTLSIPFIGAMLDTGVGGTGLADALDGGSASTAASVVSNYQIKDLMELSPYEYFFTQLRVIVTYMRLLIFPAGQNLLYDYPKYTTINTPPVLWSLALLSFFFLLLVVIFVKSRRGKSPLGLLGVFGGLWFFIALTIESSVIPIKHLIFEHRLYLPSVGAIIFLSVVAIFFIKKLPVGIFLRSRTAPFIFTIIITIIFSVATYRRSLVWASELSLWEDIVTKSPGLSIVQNNYAKAVEGAGDRDTAMKHYLEALRINPDFAEAHNNVGRLYYEDEKNLKAEKHYKQALKINPALAEPHNNIANLYMKRNDKDKAIYHYREALRLKPASSDILFSIARYYQILGDIDEAIENYKDAISITPWHYRSHYALAVLYQDRGGDNDKVIVHYKEAIASNPDLTLAHYNIATAYIEEGDVGAAITHYKECIRLEPGKHDYHFNLAWAYQSAGMSDEAITEYKEAIAIDPDIKETHYNLGLAYMIRNKFQKAMDEFSEAVRIDPGYKEAREALENDVWGGDE